MTKTSDQKNNITTVSCCGDHANTIIKENT